MRLVIDTNVPLSALISSVSPSAQILALWRSRKFELLTSAEQVDEIARVTRYPRIRARLAPALAGRLVNRLLDVAIVVEKLPKVDRSPDPDNNYLLALTEAGQAHFLITGDKPLSATSQHGSLLPPRCSNCSRIKAPNDGAFIENRNHRRTSATSGSKDHKDQDEVDLSRASRVASCNGLTNF